MPAKVGNQNARRHGHSQARGTYHRSLTYNTWRTMKERCYREDHKWYNCYGGKGVTMCDRWLGKDGFANFLADVGERPGKSMTLHRLESSKGYCKSNCRWASKWEQNVDLPRSPDGRYGSTTEHTSATIRSQVAEGSHA